MELGPNPLTAITLLAYVASGVALWKIVHWFFEFTEKHLAGDTKATIALWLLDAKSPESVGKWPETFPEVFDAIFGQKHRQARCFWRSALSGARASAGVRQPPERCSCENIN